MATFFEKPILVDGDGNRLDFYELAINGEVKPGKKGWFAFTTQDPEDGPCNMSVDFKIVHVFSPTHFKVKVLWNTLL